MIIFQISIYQNHEGINFEGIRLVPDEGKSPPTPMEKVVADAVGLAMNAVASGLSEITGPPILHKPYEEHEK